MVWALEGDCNHCGECCKRSGGIITGNCMIDADEDRCKFYNDRATTEKFGHCLITSQGDTPIEEVLNRYGESITLDQLVWFNENCPDYPGLHMVSDVNDKNTKISTMIPPECTYSFVWK